MLRTIKWIIWIRNTANNRVNNMDSKYVTRGFRYLFAHSNEVFCCTPVDIARELLNQISNVCYLHANCFHMGGDYCEVTKWAKGELSFVENFFIDTIRLKWTIRFLLSIKLKYFCAFVVMKFKNPRIRVTRENIWNSWSTVL